MTDTPSSQASTTSLDVGRFCGGEPTPTLRTLVKLALLSGLTVYVAREYPQIAMVIGTWAAWYFMTLFVTLLVWVRNRKVAVIIDDRGVSLRKADKVRGRVAWEDVHSLHWTQAGILWPSAKMAHLNDAAGATHLTVPIPLRLDQPRVSLGRTTELLDFTRERTRGLTIVEELRRRTEGRESFGPRVEFERWNDISQWVIRTNIGVMLAGMTLLPAVLCVQVLPDVRSALNGEMFRAIGFGTKTLLMLLLVFQAPLFMLIIGSPADAELRDRVRGWRKAKRPTALPEGDYRFFDAERDSATLDEKNGRLVWLGKLCRTMTILSAVSAVALLFLVLEGPGVVFAFAVMAFLAWAWNLGGREVGRAIEQLQLIDDQLSFGADGSLVVRRSTGERLEFPPGSGRRVPGTEGYVRFSAGDQVYLANLAAWTRVEPTSAVPTVPDGVPVKT